MRIVRVLVSVAVAGLIASPSLAFSARNGFSVQATSNGNFQVMNRGGLSNENAWCAAGDYAMGVLGVPPGTPIFRVSPPPAPRGANVEFSLSSVGATSSTGLSTIGGNGSASVAAVSARNMCNNLVSPGGRR